MQKEIIHTKRKKEFRAVLASFFFNPRYRLKGMGGILCAAAWEGVTQLGDAMALRDSRPIGCEGIQEWSN